MWMGVKLAPAEESWDKSQGYLIMVNMMNMVNSMNIMMKMITMITIRELSPGPQLLQRRAPSTAGSLASLRFIILIMTITFYPQGLHLMTIAMMTMTIHLSSSRSPFGSQQNLAGGQHHSRFDIFIINLHHHHPNKSSSIFSHFFSTTSG